MSFGRVSFVLGAGALLTIDRRDRRIGALLRHLLDASVLAPALSDDSDEGDHLRQRLRGQRLIAPELIDLEVQSVLRSGVRRGLLDERRARQAWGDLASMPLHRAGHRPLLPRAWELRDNLTTYDAAYVALAEVLGATLLTADSKLANASGIRCDVELAHAHRAMLRA